MPKWEYLFVHFSPKEEGEQAWQLLSISNQELKDWASKLSIADLSNALGEQGWELISLSPVAGLILLDLPVELPTELGHLKLINRLVLTILVFKRIKSV